MKNNSTKSKTAVLGGIVAISLLSPLAHAQIIFFDDFTEDANSTYSYGLSGTQNSLTYAPAGAPTNTLAWTSNQSTSYYGTGNIYNGGTVGLGYANGTTATNGSNTEVFLIQRGSGSTGSDVKTPIETSTGAAVDVVSGASYTLSLDVGDRTDKTMSTLGIDLLVGGSVVAPNTDGFTDEVTVAQLTSGKFTNFSFSIPASELTGDSGDALGIELVNEGDHDQVNFSNIEVSETAAVPEPGTWAMLLGGLGSLFFFQRIRRGLKA